MKHRQLQLPSFEPFHFRIGSFGPFLLLARNTRTVRDKGEGLIEKSLEFFLVGVVQELFKMLRFPPQSAAMEWVLIDQSCCHSSTIVSIS